ncbi:ribose-5-phosphate isomerase RpiA [Bacteroidota bacterium]
MFNQNELKRKAAYKAAEYIESGMILGLGTGSTVQYLFERMAELIAAGDLKDLKCIASSKRTELEADRLKIPLSDLNKNPGIDLTIDGADEVDKNLNLIKGGGGAMLREKILFQASKKVVIVIDESKYSNKLGDKSLLPVEVVPIALETEKIFLESLGFQIKLRNDKSGNMFIADEGNYIIDVETGKIDDPQDLAALLNKRAGIIEHGLFTNNMVSSVLIAGSSGGVRILLRED